MIIQQKFIHNYYPENNYNCWFHFKSGKYYKFSNLPTNYFCKNFINSYKKADLIFSNTENSRRKKIYFICG